MPKAVVYSYLRQRYDSDVHRAASLAAKGYVPDVRRMEDDGGSHLAFGVPGRDPLLRVFLAGWTWSYDLAASPDGTVVTIEYRWGLGMSILGFGTTKHQAANELVETAMALDALAASA